MAIIRQLDRAFTGRGATAQKIAKVDRLESAGSLLLVDPTHPYYPEKAGNFSNGEAVRNIFRDTLVSLSGASSGLDAKMIQQIAGTPRINVERTGKGGIHAIVQQQGSSVVTSDIYRLAFPTAVLNYMDNHLSNDYYISLWQRTTRSSTYSGGALYPTYLTLVGIPANSTVSAVFSTAAAVLIGGALGSNAVAPNSEINHLFAAGIPNVFSAIDASYSSLWINGGFSAWNSSGTGGSQAKLPSQIFYRAYIEDLTVSGRTYSEVFALDNALYTKEVLTEGGRYYGDTFTDPDTVVFPA